VRAFLARKVKHEPIEYYSSWGGYTDPIGLYNKITKEEADAIAARRNAYLIGYFNADNRAERIVKMLRGKAFFECLYTYYPNGRLKRAQNTNPDGFVTAKIYDERGRRVRSYGPRRHTTWWSCTWRESEGAPARSLRP